MGIKLCWLLSDSEQVVAWYWATMSVHDQHFYPVIEGVNGQRVVLANYSFRSAEGIPDNCQLCAKGTRNEHICGNRLVDSVRHMRSQAYSSSPAP